jgi:hypothetical protein
VCDAGQEMAQMAHCRWAMYDRYAALIVNMVIACTTTSSVGSIGQQHCLHAQGVA